MKGVCDFGDEYKDSQYQLYASCVSAMTFSIFCAR